MKQRTIIEALQSRIDFNSGEITYHEHQREYARMHNILHSSDPLALLRHNQCLDKRLLGYVIDLHRHLKLLHSVADRVWQAEYDANVKAQRESEG